MGTENEAVNDLFGVPSDEDYKKKVLEKYKNNNILSESSNVNKPESMSNQLAKDDDKKEKILCFKSSGQVGNGFIDTPEELVHLEASLSFFKRNFWDLWLQKIFRNFASMKFQLLVMLYIPVIWGMFNIRPGTEEPWISAAIGLGFLGGGYVTLAVSRSVSKTNLVENSDIKFDTDR